jgi:integrase
VSISIYRQRNGVIGYRVRVFVEGVRVSYGVFTTREEAEDVEAAALEARGAKESGTTLRAWGESWLNERERGKRVRGIDKERSAWRAHIASTELAAMTLTRIKRHHVVRWLRDLAAKEPRLAHSTMRTARRLVVGAIEAALNDGLVDENPARGAPITARDEHTKERWHWMTVDELQRLFALPVHDTSPNVANGYRKAGHITTKQRSASIVAIYTGMRAGELWGLRWRDVRLDGPQPRVVVRYSRELATKSGKPREVPLLAPAREALLEWQRVCPGVGDALVFPAIDGHCHRGAYTPGWDRIKELAGIRPAVRWHDLRHTCGSHLVQGTWGRVWSLPEVRDWLGHGSIKMTERYAHLRPGGLHDAAAMTSGAMVAPRQADVIEIGGKQP